MKRDPEKTIESLIRYYEEGVKERAEEIKQSVILGRFDDTTQLKGYISNYHQYIWVLTELQMFIENGSEGVLDIREWIDKDQEK